MSHPFRPAMIVQLLTFACFLRHLAECSASADPRGSSGSASIKRLRKRSRNMSLLVDSRIPSIGLVRSLVLSTAAWNSSAFCALHQAILNCQCADSQVLGRKILASEFE